MSKSKLENQGFVQDIFGNRHIICIYSMLSVHLELGEMKYSSLLNTKKDSYFFKPHKMIAYEHAPTQDH